MAMLNSALGAELTSEGGCVETRVEQESQSSPHHKETTEDYPEEETDDTIHDTNTQNNSR